MFLNLPIGAVSQKWAKSKVFFGAFVLFLAFFSTLFFKGGIGLSNHLIFFLLIGSSGLLLILLIFKNELRINDLSSVDSLLLVVFLGLFTSSAFFSTTKNVGFMEVGEIFAGVILIFWGYALLQERSVLEKLFVFLNGSLFLSILIGFSFFFLGHFERFAGTFHNYFEPWSAFPNAYGDLAILLLPTTWYLVEKNKKMNAYKAYYFYLGLFLLGIVSIYLSGSKGIFVAAFFGGGLIALRALLSRSLLKEFLIVMAAGLLIGFGFSQLKIILNPDYRETVVSTTGEVIDPLQFEAVGSFSSRAEHYKISWPLLIQAPFLGYGPGSYPYISARYLPFLNTADHPHNLFLKVALESGILTSFVLVVFFLKIIMQRLWRFRREGDAFREFILVGFLGFLAHQLIDYNLQFTTIIFLVFLAIGMLLSPREKVSPHTLQNLEERSGSSAKKPPKPSAAFFRPKRPGSSKIFSLSAEKPSLLGKIFLIRRMSILVLMVCSFLLIGFTLHMGVLKVLGKLEKDPERVWLIEERMLFKPNFLVDLVMHKLQKGVPLAEVRPFIEKGLKDNVYDARLYALNGDFKRAYELNPHQLDYLLGFYTTAAPDERDLLKTAVRDILTKYLFLLQTNTNFTILTSNPIAAIKLADALEDRNLFQSLTLAFEKQKRKFAYFYGISYVSF